MMMMADNSDDQGSGRRRLPGRMFDRVVGSVVSPIVDNVDVGDVAERIDVNHLIERIDVDELLDEIDVNRLLDRVDANRLLDRVDPDRLLERVDPDRLLERVTPDVLLDRVDPDALLDRVDPDRLLDRVDADRLLARVDPDALLDRVDIDRLLDRIDPNALLDRVDPNALLDRVDPEALLDRVDVNQLLERVDPNLLLDRVDTDRLLERVDVNDLVERTEISAIIARSTTGVFTQLLDVARTQVVLTDQVAQGVPAGILRGAARELPPTPGGPEDHVDARRMDASERAVAVQGRCAGSVSRFLAFLIDQFAIGALFTLGVVLVQSALRVITQSSFEIESARYWVVAAYALWSFVYLAGSVAATGRTIGKAILGVLVVRSDGSRVNGRHAALRTIAFPLSFLLFGIGFLIGLIRRDRRELHDLIAGTTVVYAWDAKTARLRADAQGSG